MAMTPEQLEIRIAALLDTCTYTVYNYTRRGLFDRDKLIVLTLLTFQILLRSGGIDLVEYEALCKGGRSAAPPPVTDDLSRWVPVRGCSCCMGSLQLWSVTEYHVTSQQHANPFKGYSLAKHSHSPAHLCCRRQCCCLPAQQVDE